MRFPGLYGRWTGHDLADHGPGLGSIRPGFYEGLWREDEPLVWRFIEDNYLLRYRDFLRVEHEWTAEGLWRVPFPGSVGMGEFRSPVDYGMPAPLATRLRAWQANLDTRNPFADPDDEDFDYEASDAEGLEISKEVKLYNSTRLALASGSKALTASSGHLGRCWRRRQVRTRWSWA